NTFVAEPFGVLISIGISSFMIVWLDRTSRDWFEGPGQRKQAEIRRAAIDLGVSELGTEKLIARFEALLCQEYRTRSAALLIDRGAAYRTGPLALHKNRAGHSFLLEVGWATPESLLRRRSTEGLSDLQSFLARHTLGVIVTVPLNCPAPTMLLALGTKT